MSRYVRDTSLEESARMLAAWTLNMPSVSGSATKAALLDAERRGHGVLRVHQSDAVQTLELAEALLFGQGAENVVRDADAGTLLATFVGDRSQLVGVWVRALGPEMSAVKVVAAAEEQRGDAPPPIAETSFHERLAAAVLVMNAPLPPHALRRDRGRR